MEPRIGLSIPANREVLGFVWVGAIGFLVDATVLTLLIKAHSWDHYSARLVSFGAAVSITWYLNRRWTFSRRATNNRRTEYARYFAVQTIGALLNFGVYAACIAADRILASYPVIPLAVGSAVAMVFNFAASKRFVFTQHIKATGDGGG